MRGLAYGFAIWLPGLLIELSELRHSRQMLRMLERDGFVKPNAELTGNPGSRD